MMELIISNIVPILIGVVVVILVGVVAAFLLRSRVLKDAPQQQVASDPRSVGSQTEGSGLEDARRQKRGPAKEDPNLPGGGMSEFGLQLVLDDDQVFHLDLPTTIGRSRENSIVISDDSVSIQHARIYFDVRLAAVCIEDLNSTNGIFIDGRPTRVNVLEDGARLSIGSVSLTFRDTGYLPPA
jgi:hypothetical protein